jgi:hypothetical protein
MAFTEAQLRTISTILQVTPFALDLHLDANPYDADTQTAVETELTRWATAKSVFESMEPMERNFGVRRNSGDEKADIRRNIAILLEFDMSMVTSNRLVRA